MAAVADDTIRRHGRKRPRPIQYVRAVCVLLLLLYAWLYHVPAILNFTSHPYIGDIGIVWDHRTGQIDKVNRDSPAARNGIVAGDRLDIRPGPDGKPTPLGWRLANARLLDARPVDLPIVTRNGTKKTVRVIPTAWHFSELSPVTEPLLLTTALQCILASALAAALYLLKPSIMTAGFFAYGLLTTNNLEVLSLAPDQLLPAAVFIDALTAGAGFSGLTVFFFRFPSGKPLHGWIILEKVCVATIMLIAVPLYFERFVQRAELHLDFSRTLYYWFTVVCWTALAVGFTAALVRYRRLEKSEQIRMRWVILGFTTLIVSFFAFFIEHVLRPDMPHYSVWWTTGDWAVDANLLVPTVAYAVLRHHVLGIRIIGSRAIVYAVITSVPLLILTAAGDVLGTEVKKSPLLPTAQIMIGAALAYAFSQAKAPVDKFTRQVFLRDKIRNEERLRDQASGARWSADLDVMRGVIVHKVADYLDIASVALFEREEDQIKRVASVGWSVDALCSVETGSAFALELAGRSKALSADRFEDLADLPQGDNRPLYALPILGKGGLRAFFFVSGHSDGEALDRDEQKSLAHVASAAEAAYEADHIARDKATLEDLRAEIRLLRNGLKTNPSPA